jgi:tetratricopeptide (TPR) repeat protein
VRAAAIALAKAGAMAWVDAAPRVPATDDEIVESLPAVAGWSREARAMRRELQQRPTDAAVAVAAAARYLALARSQGDARYAGHAMGALGHWAAVPPNDTPPPVLVMRATIAQFLHDFDGAQALLKTALARQPSNAQAWITLATIHRVRGRYDESDAACRALGRVGPALYGLACAAENAGLRGNHDEARGALKALLQDPRLQTPEQAGTRQWLLTSLAEIEELAGRPAEAEVAYRLALQAERSGYLLLAYSDYLQRAGRPKEIPALLGSEARSDAVLLRLAIATRGFEGARTDAAELRARFGAAAERPDTSAAHAREEAMFALDVDGDARRALDLARLNVQLQREPIDLLLFARAAVAARDEPARTEVRALVRQIGLRDARVEALL